LRNGWWLLFCFAWACGPTERSVRPIGDPCAPLAPGEVSEECQDQLCVALDNFSGFCTRTCTVDDDCPGNYLCEAAGRYGRVCKKLVGCQQDGECPAGHVCNAQTGNCYIKVARTLCSPCQDEAQCPEGGACFKALGSGEQFCTSGCAEGDLCPPGFECQQIPSGEGGALQKQCVPLTQTCSAGKSVCSPCRGDAECGGYFDLCVRNVVSGETFCSRDCRPGTSDCPEGFSCVDLGGGLNANAPGPFQCVPNSNTCQGYCDAVSEALQIQQCGLGRTCELSAKSCRPATDGRMCAPCIDNDDCRGGDHPENRCIVNDCADCAFKGESFCSTPCANDAACVQSFGVGFVCKPVVLNTGESRPFCMPQRGSCQGGLRRIGEDCTVSGANECITGICLVAGSHRLCSANCTQDADCGDTRFQCCEASASGYDCSPERRTATGPLSGAGVCAPQGGLFGDDCSPGRAPCQSGACLDLGTARVCTVTCGGGAGCPEGFRCLDAEPLSGGDPVPVCFPSGGGQAGADCTFGPAACDSKLCIRKESGPICTAACASDAECLPDWSCKVLPAVGGGSVDACLPQWLE
jgi:hypothetical protein